MTPVRCSGCNRKIGVSLGEASQRNKLWCSEACQLDGEVSPEVERNDLWLALHDVGRSDTAIAALWGVDRTNVGRVVRARRPARFTRGPGRRGGLSVVP